MFTETTAYELLDERADGFHRIRADGKPDFYVRFCAPPTDVVERESGRILFCQIINKAKECPVTNIKEHTDDILLADVARPSFWAHCLSLDRPEATVANLMAAAARSPSISPHEAMRPLTEDPAEDKSHLVYVTFSNRQAVTCDEDDGSARLLLPSMRLLYGGIGLAARDKFRGYAHFIPGGRESYFSQQIDRLQPEEVFCYAIRVKDGQVAKRCEAWLVAATGSIWLSGGCNIVPGGDRARKAKACYRPLVDIILQQLDYVNDLIPLTTPPRGEALRACK